MLTKPQPPPHLTQRKNTGTCMTGAMIEYVYVCVCVCVCPPHQLVGLVDGEHAAVEPLAHVNVGVGQQADELLALVLHAREGDGDLIVVQLL